MSEGGGGEVAQVFARQMEYANKIHLICQDKQTTRQYVGELPSAAAYKASQNNYFEFEVLKAELSHI